MWNYYVYELVDPRNGEVFYVGKGCGNRIDAHEREAEKGVSSKKCNKIRKIWASNLAVNKRKVAYFFDESDAYAFEDARIREYGKSNLCNVAPLIGGEEKQTLNPFLSKHFMRLMAIGYRSLAGYPPDCTGRPFAAAMHKEFMRRFGEFQKKAVDSIGLDALKDGLIPFGVTFANGR